MHLDKVTVKDKGKVLKRLTDVVRIMAKIDPCLRYRVDPETKDLLLSGAGELHLQVVLAKLRELSFTEEGLTLSPPRVAMRETATLPMPVVGVDGATMASVRERHCDAKSSNKLNRVVVTASLMPESFLAVCETVNMNAQATQPLAELLRNHGLLDVNAKKVYAFGPRDTDDGELPTCMLVNSTTGIVNIGDLQAGLSDAFQQLCNKGPLGAQRLRGVRFDVVDAKIHQDPAHRRPQQTVPMCARAFTAALKIAGPSLMEPQYLAVATSSPEKLKDVLSVFAVSNAQVISVGTENDDEDGGGGGAEDHTRKEPMVVRALLPVRCSFGLSGQLQGRTAGRAMVSLHAADWLTHSPEASAAILDAGSLEA